MTREFQVGDKVFSTTYGILEVIEVDSGNVFTGLNPRCMFTLDGKASYKCKYPGIYHLDEALKLFPMWLEEVEEEYTQIRYGIYYDTNNSMDNYSFADPAQRDAFMKALVYAKSHAVPIEIHIKTKRKIIREKQQ